MANFTVNIMLPAPSWNGPGYHLFDVDGCTPIMDFEQPLGMWPGSIPTGQGVFVYSNLYMPSPLVYSTLHIYNLNSTALGTFYLEYDGVKMLPAVDPEGDPENPMFTIDVLGIAPGADIPGLKLIFDTHNASGASDLLTFDSYTKDQNGWQSWIVQSSYSITSGICEPQQETSIIETYAEITPCQTYSRITVPSPNPFTRWVEIVANDSFGTVLAGHTISVETDYELWVYGDTSGPNNTYSSVSLNIYANENDSSIIDFYTLRRNHNGTYC
jgi:hypothetical protein